MDGAGFCLFPTPIGECAIAWREGTVVGVLLPGEYVAQTRSRMAGRFPDLHESGPPPAMESIIGRIRGLLEGAHDDLLDVPLDMNGVASFNQRVYAVARAIAPGRTLTYGEVAARLGEPGASRAVGQALGHNPFAPVVPCHRVLAAGARGGGFSAAGGVSTKLRMLEIERASFTSEPGLFDSLPFSTPG